MAYEPFGLLENSSLRFRCNFKSARRTFDEAVIVSHLDLSNCFFLSQPDLMTFKNKRYCFRESLKFVWYS